MDEDLRCSSVSRTLGIDPVGTAGHHQRFLLVEVPLPWPADVTCLPLLAPAAATPGTRVLAVVGGRAPRRDTVAATVWSRHRTNAMVGTDHVLAATDAGAALAALAAGHPEPATVVGPAPPEVVVCGHGSRDRCCGRFGTRLQLAVADRWPGVRVRRGSHTGGHRFAPTGLTFPDGRAWAYLDEAVLDAVVGRAGDPARLAGHDRGWTGADARSQPLERAVLGALGWRWLDAEVTVRSVTPLADPRRSGAADAVFVALAWRFPDGATGEARGRVEVRRRVPVPPCGAPLGVNSKGADELVLRSFELEGPTEASTAPTDRSPRPRATHRPTDTGGHR